MPNINISSYDAANCSCSSALSSADYTIHYIRRDNGYYYVEKIVVDLTVFDSLTLDSKFCAANNDQATFVPQSFSVNYQTSTTGSNAFFKSGNPGYIINRPVLVSETGERALK
jgi:hypothetical protein